MRSAQEPARAVGLLVKSGTKKANLTLEHGGERGDQDAHHDRQAEFGGVFGAIKVTPLSRPEGK